MSEWSHLANAKHIDLIIAHAKANPAAWYSAYDAAWETAVWETAVWDAAWNAAWGADWDAAWNVNTARAAAYDAARAAAVNTAAWGAMFALVAWDYTGGLMDLPAEQVKVLAILGDQAAILMYPAIAVMETTQELV